MNAEEFIQTAAQSREMLSTLVRELAGMKVPEFSSEPITIKDVAQLIGLTESEVRAGILYGWLPIGVAVRDGKPITGKCTGRASFVIYPRKVWEVTGHIWRGKAALCS